MNEPPLYVHTYLCTITPRAIYTFTDHFSGSGKAIGPVCVSGQQLAN